MAVLSLRVGILDSYLPSNEGLLLTSAVDCSLSGGVFGTTTTFWVLRVYIPYNISIFKDGLEC